MAALDLTTLTVHDTQSILTIEPNKITVGENGHANLSAWVCKDFGDGGIKNFEYKFKFRFKPTTINYEAWIFGTILQKNIFVISNKHSEKLDVDQDVYPVVRFFVSPIADFNNMLDKPFHYSLSSSSLNRNIPTDNSAFNIIKEGDEKNQIIDWVFNHCLKEHGDNYNWWWKITHLDNGYDRPLTFVYVYKSPEMTEENFIANGCTAANSDDDVPGACEGCPGDVFDGKFYILNPDDSFNSALTIIENAVDDDNVSNHIYRDDATIRTYVPRDNMDEHYIVRDSENVENNLPYVDHYYTIRRTGETYTYTVNYQGQPTDYQVEKVEISVYTDVERTELIAQGHVGVTPNETYRYFYPLQLIGYESSKEISLTGNYEISECDLTLL